MFSRISAAALMALLAATPARAALVYVSSGDFRLGVADTATGTVSGIVTLTFFGSPVTVFDIATAPNGDLFAVDDTSSL